MATNGLEEKEETEESNPPLLTEHSVLEEESALVSVDTSYKEGDLGIYMDSLIRKHSVRQARTILEICPRTEGISFLSPSFGKKYRVTRVFVSQKNLAVSEKDRETPFLILGEEFEFPDIKDTFDCIILHEGTFSSIVHPKGVLSFLERIRELLRPDGIIIGESYHLGGVNPEACTKNGFRNWTQYQMTPKGGQRTTITRLTVSHLDLESGCLNSSIRYQFEDMGSERTQTRIEAFAIRVYAFPELTYFLRQSKLHRIHFYRGNTNDSADLKTFKFTFVTERL